VNVQDSKQIPSPSQQLAADIIGEVSVVGGGSEPACVDLQAVYGDRYKIELDESYSVEKSEFRFHERNWLTQIPCLNGHIGVWGNNLLVARTSSSGTVAMKLKRLSFAEIVQDGTDGVNVTFNVQHFDEVAAVMKPRKRRQGRPMTYQEKQELVEAGRKFRFSTGR
jgi:hypothetical protein